MAKPRVIKLDPFKRGDTPAFRLNFSEPYTAFDWNNVTLDLAMTSVAAPNDNAGAAAYRPAESLTVETDNSAYYIFQPTVLESKALSPLKYKIEVQLKDNGGQNVATPITCEVEVLQDYVV